MILAKRGYLQRLWTSRRLSASPHRTAVYPAAPVRATHSHVPIRMNHHSSTSSLVAPHFFDRVLAHSERTALYDATSSTTQWTYAQLLHEATRLSDKIQQALPSASRHVHAHGSERARVAYLGSRGASYVVIQWATWLAGAVAVPLHPAHPAEELQYILDDCDASALIVSDEFNTNNNPKNLQSFMDKVLAEGKTVVIHHDHDAMVKQKTQLSLPSDTEETVREWVASCPFDRTGAHIVYTSGTTGRPKGVVTSHAALTAQIHDIVRAWDMTETDHLLHFLPLHHVHGILNNLLCVHYAGGSLEFLPSAKADLIWSKLAQTDSDNEETTRKKLPPVSMLMAVPTVYMNLLEEIEKKQRNQPPPTAGSSSSYNTQAAIEGASRLRVAVSGSMACPVSILNKWETLTGLRLLERYGMTELGMVLTNPLHGERHLGYVGHPFPSVNVRLVDADTEHEIPIHSEQEGELRVKGPTVFSEYWRNPKATAKEFDAQGWFKTGDIAQYNVANESFRIRGRASADILKSGGYKLSALDIERVLLSHPEIQECAVFGIPDEKYGQIVAAVLRTTTTTLSSSSSSSPESKPSSTADGLLEPPLVEFLKDHLANYSVPRKFFVVSEIPKNAMGKVNKKSLALQFGKIE